MRLEHSWLATLAAAATLLQAAPSHAAACRTTTERPLPGQEGTCDVRGKPLYWQNECIGFRVSKELPPGLTVREAEQRLRAAFGRWTTGNPVCSPSIQMVVLAASDDTAIGYSNAGPNENLVVFGDRRAHWDPRFPDEASLATISFERSTGKILDGDLEVDVASLIDWSEQPSAPGAALVEPGIGPDLDVTLTHAVGHLLGLSHSDDEGSLLRPDFRAHRRGNPEPSDSDLAAVCAIYGEDRTRAVVGDDGQPALLPATPCNFGSSASNDAECGPADVSQGCSMRHPGTSGSLYSFLSGLAMVLGVVARRRRRSPALNPKPDPPHGSR